MPGLAPLIAHRGCAMEWAPRVLDISSHSPFRVTHKNLDAGRWTLDTGRWTLGVTLVCEVFLFQGAREL